MNSRPENNNIKKRSVLGYGWKKASETMSGALVGYLTEVGYLESTERLAYKSMQEEMNGTESIAKTRLFRVVYEELE